MNNCFRQSLPSKFMLITYYIALDYKNINTVETVTKLGTSCRPLLFNCIIISRLRIGNNVKALYRFVYRVHIIIFQLCRSKDRSDHKHNLRRYCIGFSQLMSQKDKVNIDSIGICPQTIFPSVILCLSSIQGLLIETKK